MKPNPYVTIQVNVSAGGHRDTYPNKRRRPRRARSGRHFYDISSPTINGSTQIVYQSGGVNYIEANGTSLVSSAGYPAAVYALAYNDPNETAAGHADGPDSGAVPGIINTDGTWSFNLADGSPSPPGNAIPGSAMASDASAGSNSTLIVWYEYQDEFGNPLDYTVDAVPFCAYQNGGSRPGTFHMPAHLPAAKLVAVFTGPLKGLDEVELEWNGVSWVGISSHKGGTVLCLAHRDHVYQLQASGPAASFVVAAPPSARRPFHWQAKGTSIGAVSGSFGVTITE